MTEAEKRVLQKQRQELSLKNTLFNRYLLLRYTLALFFFGNLYWLLIQLTRRSGLMLIPILLLVLIVQACAEQFKLYGKKEVALRRTKRAVKGQILIQALTMLSTLTPWFTRVYPIFADSIEARLFILSLLAIGFGLLYLNLRRIQQINQNTDKAYLRFRQMEKSVIG